MIRYVEMAWLVDSLCRNSESTNQAMPAGKQYKSAL